MKNANTQHVDSHALEQLLNRAGYKATTPRLCILRVLQRAGHPLSIAEIHKAAGKTRVNLATVYRTMRDLTYAGIVSRVDTGHSHAHYELPRAHHHHLVCKQCDKMEDVFVCDPAHLNGKTLRDSKTFASIDTHALEFFGVCKQCSDTS